MSFADIKIKEVGFDSLPLHHRTTHSRIACTADCNGRPLNEYEWESVLSLSSVKKIENNVGDNTDAWETPALVPRFIENLERSAKKLFAQPISNGQIPNKPSVLLCWRVPYVKPDQMI